MVLKKKPQEKKTPVKMNVYTYEGILPTPNKNNNKKGKRKAKQPNQEPVWMVILLNHPLTIFFLHHTLTRRMILEYLPLIV